MDTENSQEQTREMRSFLRARDPSVDRRCRPCPNKKVRLFNDIQESGESSSDDSDAESEYTTNGEDEIASSSTDVSEIESGPQVFLRLRPVEKISTAYNISDCASVLITGTANENTSTNVSKSHMEKHYSFTSIFNGSVGQRDIYDRCVGPKIQDEESVTVMAYGTSGSGKTYTLLGDDVRAGIIPRALDNIFTLYMNNLYPQPQLKLINSQMIILEDGAALKEMEIRRRILSLCPDMQSHFQRLQQVIKGDHAFETKTVPDVSIMIWISFVEVYNEFVYDLLTIPPRQATMTEPPRKNLKIVGNNGQVFIKGLTSIFVKSSEEALKLLRFGQQRLTYASTAVNSNSSRSHCVFFVDILKFHRSGITTQISYKFCDLAGSERVDKTGTVGSRLKEAQRINTSLMVLGRCLDAASSTRKKSNRDVIPYRESKLTMLLQAPLLGKERLTMIVTVTPLDKYYEENLNVLSFASIAKNIIFKQPLVKHHNSRYSGFANCAQQSDGTREYINKLEEEILKYVTYQNKLEEENAKLRAENVLNLQLLEEKLRKEFADTFQERMQVTLKQCEDHQKKKLEMQRREFELKLASIKRLHEDEIEDLQDEIDQLKSVESDIEIIDDE